MKNVTGFVLMALLALQAGATDVGGVSDAQLTEARLQGTWQALARVCESSGRPARDAFTLGRDRMLINFKGTQASVATMIEGQKASDIWLGSVNTEHRYLVMRPWKPVKSDKKITKVEFDLTQFPTLIITTGGFGEGGSCSPGETLKTYFRLTGGAK